MKTYIVNWNRNDYGYIKIIAESENEARELFLSGEFNKDSLFIKDGGMDVDSVTEE